MRTTWEFDIDMMVRRTLVFSGPRTEEEAREIATLVLHGDLNADSMWKWTLAPNGRFVPLEVPIEGAASIAAIRRIDKRTLPFDAASPGDVQIPDWPARLT